MTHDRTSRGDNRGPLTASDGGRVTRQQIMNVLANPGYSAGQRKGRLKEALTELEQEEGRAQSEEDRRLARAIKKILDDYQAGKPISDDTL